jgi:hypothetical protein
MNKDNTIKIKELNLDMIQPNSKNYMNPDQGGSKIVIIGKPGCFTKGTEILMYDGTVKEVENITVGDKVMGLDSTPRKVLELCRNIDKMYMVKPSNGDIITVNEQHILTLKYTKKIENYIKEVIVDISVKDYLDQDDIFKNNYKWFRKGVLFSNNNLLKIDPYCLGVMLGSISSKVDYNFNNISNSTILNYVKKCFVKKGYELTYDGRIEYYKQGTNDITNYFLNKLFNINKHIPHEYKTSSHKNRLKILAGIIDSNYKIDNDIYTDKEYSIIQNSEQMIDDIIFITRSLGFECYKKEFKIISKGELSDMYYKCTITGDGIEEIPTKINKIIKKEETKESKLTYNFTIKYKNIDQYYGFTTDGDHRFLLSDFSVVHNSGKSTLIADLLYSKKDIFPIGMVMSGTEDSNHFFKKIIPSSFVFNNYDEDKIIEFIKRQKIAKEHLQNPWSLLIIDDCTDDPSIFRKQTQNSLYKLGRHWKMLYILSLQYSMDIRPSIRNNVDGVFIFREPNNNFRKNMYDNYASIIPSYQLFCSILNQITDDHTALYINNTAGTNDWNDCVFWYKAKIIPKDFKFGCEDFWKFHNQRYNNKYKDNML